MVTLVFPPSWYFPTVPADLTMVAGGLRAAGVSARCVDFNAQGAAVLLGEVHAELSTAGGWETERYAALVRRVGEEEWEVKQRHGCRWSWPGDLAFDESTADLEVCTWLASSDQNPYRGRLSLEPLLEAEVVAFAFVHPGQLVPMLGLARELREAGFEGTIVAYGAFEDVLEPRSLGIGPTHDLFLHLDGLLCGDPVAGLVDLVSGTSPVRGLLGPGGANPTAPVELHAPDFRGLSGPYGTPTPVVDLRLSVGCTWNRCTFCAIPAHHTYRAVPAVQAQEAMVEARAELGSTVFRFRDDLLSPIQVDALADVLAGGGFVWSHRARFGAGWEPRLLERARASGLTEIWFGMESASARVRKRMKKGVSARQIDADLLACERAGIRVRVLLMVGFPGETLAEFQETVDFLGNRAHQLVGFALTPFILMRDAPIAQTAQVRVLADPVPAHRSLRWALPFEYVDGPSRREWQGALARARWDLRGAVPKGSLGPVLDWVASIASS